MRNFIRSAILAAALLVAVPTSAQQVATLGKQVPDVKWRQDGSEGDVNRMGVGPRGARHGGAAAPDGCAESAGAPISSASRRSPAIGSPSGPAISPSHTGTNTTLDIASV